MVRTKRGSSFMLCEMSRVDPAFPRYPRLPVLRCRGFEASGRDDTESRGFESQEGAEKT